MADVLIIKLGYVEEMPDTVSHLASLSDVFTSTTLLKHFESDNVTVVTRREATGFFKGLANVRRVLAYDCHVSMNLAHEHFDVVVNLEPAWEFCALADSIWADKRMGFALDEYGQEVIALDGAEDLLIHTKWPHKRRELDRPMQELLYSAVGSRWTGQNYALGVKATSEEEYDLGFNVQCDHGWENRNWSEMRWRELERLAEPHYTISYSYREYGDDLEDYVNWIASCRVLVTPDSLGMHLALALGKRVVTLMGPTSANGLHMYGRGETVTPKGQFDCRPCYEQECHCEEGCIESIAAKDVMNAVTRQVQVALSAGKHK